MIPGDFNCEKPKEIILEKGDRKDLEYLHKINYGTPKKFIEGYSHFFDKKNIIEKTATNVSLLNSLYAIERFSTMKIFSIKIFVRKKNARKKNFLT